jgi:hypothetical protein
MRLPLSTFTMTSISSSAMPCFKDRFSGEADDSAKGEQIRFLLQTNFVPDAVNLPLIVAKGVAPATPHPFQHGPRLSEPRIQFPVGTYKKAHAHGPGAHVIVLSGEGYSLMWPEEEPRRFVGRWERS